MAAPPISPSSARHVVTPMGREFCIAVQLHAPLASASGPGKSHPVKKRSEGRLDFLRLTSASDDGGRKLKERASILGLSKSTAGPETWRSATCKLSEEPEGTFLSIYTTDNALVHSIRIDTLNHTDIRQADRSLFFGHKNTLGIHLSSSKTNPGSAREPIYLDFQHVDALYTWIALLRSYTTPEIYGRHLTSSSGREDDGGLYRMWRQIDLTILDGRGLGLAGSGSKSPSVSPDDLPEAGSSSGANSDMAVYCEAHLGGVLAGRTTVQRGGAPDWQETFAFTDLPPVQALHLVLCRERRQSGRAGTRTVLGRATLHLANLKRGEAVEEWFPVLAGGEPEPVIEGLEVVANGGPTTTVGQLRVRVKIDDLSN